MIEYQQARLAEAEDARIELAKKHEEETNDKAKKALERQKQTRWSEPRTPNKFNASTTKPNKANITADSSVAFSLDVGKGPDILVREMLVAGLAQEVSAGNMTQSEVDAYVAEKMDDKEFVATSSADVVADLLAVRISSGQKLNDREHSVISGSEWGKGAIDKALNKNAEIKQMFEKARADGLIQGDILTAIKDNPNLLYLLLAMIGGTVAIAAGAPLLAAGAVGAGGFKAFNS